MIGWVRPPPSRSPASAIAYDVSPMSTVSAHPAYKEGVYWSYITRLRHCTGPGGLEKELCHQLHVVVSCVFGQCDIHFSDLGTNPLSSSITKGAARNQICK